MDWNDIHEWLVNAARSVGAEITSPWFYTQFGIILAAAGISLAVGTMIRRRVDSSSVAMGLPAPVRLFVRVLLRSAGTLVFALLMTATRATMLMATWPSRSYLIAVAGSLAYAWLIIRFATSLIHNDFIVRVVSIAAWINFATLSSRPSKNSRSKPIRKPFRGFSMSAA